MSPVSSNDNCSSNSCTDDDEELNEQLQSLLSLLPKMLPSRTQHLENLNQRSIAYSPSQRRRLQILRREFVVKILWKRLGPGVEAEVQRSIEFCSDLNFKMNFVLVPSFLNPDEMHTTASSFFLSEEKTLLEKRMYKRIT
ncbi:hypothetical protein MKX03_013652, partial [Papaver bracteatum]